MSFKIHKTLNKKFINIFQNQKLNQNVNRVRNKLDKKKIIFLKF